MFEIENTFFEYVHRSHFSLTHLDFTRKEFDSTLALSGGYSVTACEHYHSDKTTLLSVSVCLCL